MKVRLIRYFYPNGFVSNLWDSYDRLDDFKDFLLTFQQEFSCYTFHVDISGFYVLYLNEEYPTNSFVSVRKKKTNYLGTDMTRHKLRKINRENKHIASRVFSKLEPHSKWLTGIVSHLVEISTEEYVCQLQFLISGNQIVPIVAVYDSVDISDLTPLFETPLNSSWVEIPSGVLEGLIYQPTENNLKEDLYLKKDNAEFTTDWAVLESLKPLIVKYQQSSELWSKVEKQSYQNKIHTLMSIARQAGIDVDTLLYRAGLQI